MADATALRRIGLTFSAIAALVALLAATTVIRATPETRPAAFLASEDSQ